MAPAYEASEVDLRVPVKPGDKLRIDMRRTGTVERDGGMSGCEEVLFEVRAAEQVVMVSGRGLLRIPSEPRNGGSSKL